MPETEIDENLEHFIARVQLLLAGKTIEGLDVWAKTFADLRQISQFELCQRLVQAIRNADLPTHGIGVVRYGEGWLYDRMGRWQDSLRAYQASMAAFRQAGIQLDATLLTQIGSIHQDQGDWEAAGEAYKEALLAALPDSRERGMVLNNLGGLALERNDPTEAQRHYTEARELLRDRDDRNFAAATHGLAGVLRDLGRLQESQDMDLECLSIFQSLGDHHGVGSSIGGIATTQLYAGRYREAIHNYEVALQLFLESGDHVSTTKTLANLAVAYQEDGALKTALEYLAQAIEGYREVRDHHGEAVALVNLSRLLAKTGDADAAWAAADAARTFCCEHGFDQELLRLPEDER